MALGVSAIGRIGASYYQNAKTLPEYHESLRKGLLPVVRGHALTPEDELRSDVIMALMCQGRLEFEPIERAHGVRFADHFARELEALGPMARSGLVELEEGAIQVTAAGWFLVRAIAMVFDHHLQAAPGTKPLLPRRLSAVRAGLPAQGFSAMVTRAVASVMARTPCIASPARKSNSPASSRTVAPSSSMPRLPSSP